MLPKLTVVNLKGCSRCKTLPCFVQLPYLKSLELCDLEKVEYMEHGSSDRPFFPSLEYLKLQFMPKLKELWTNLPTHPPPSFPCLSQLDIKYCKELVSLELHSSPLLSKLRINKCPKLKSLLLPPSPLLSHLEIWYCSDLASLELQSSPLLYKLQIWSCPKLTSFLLPPSPLLSQLEITGCDELVSLELHSSPLLSSLEIFDCLKLTSVSVQVSSLPCLKTLQLHNVREEVLRQLMLAATAPESVCIERIDDLITLPDELHRCASTLQTLKIWGCPQLATLPHWIGNLTLLTHLHIGSCHQLQSLPEEFRSLRTLKSFTIHDWSALTTLPDWIGSLSSLEHLRIHECPKLTSLPEEIRSLTTLETLKIFHCPHLSERCQRENGDDWPRILHVPDIIID